jgi:hypothetical protein
MQRRVWFRSRRDGSRATDRLDRTHETVGRAGGADHGTEIHQRLVEFPGGASLDGQDLIGKTLDAATVRGAVGQPTEEHAAQHSVHVGVDGRYAPLVRKRGNGSCSVGPYARQTHEVLGVVRNAAVVLAHDHARGGMKVRSPSIVSETIPGASHRMGRRLGQRFECGVPSQEATIVTQHTRDLCLLEHEFGNQYAVWITGMTPRQGASIASKPFQDASLEREASRHDVISAHARGIYDRRRHWDIAKLLGPEMRNGEREIEAE